MFFYPEFDAEGAKILCREGGQNGDMLMDITVYKMKAGESRNFYEDSKEIAILLTEGKVRLQADGVDTTVSRKDVFSEGPTCLHLPKGKQAGVSAMENSEIICLATTNLREFPVKLYKKEDIKYTVSSEGIWENTAVRDVNTIFDYSNAPYSNLVVGEVLARQGRWWSYVPHSHPQPEVYYYKFPRPEGFGACFINDIAYTVKDGSCGCFKGGNTHVQVTAPCYPEYCCWMIRHLDGDPWLKTRNVHPDYKWIEDDLSKINYKQFK